MSSKSRTLCVTSSTANTNNVFKLFTHENALTLVFFFFLKRKTTRNLMTQVNGRMLHLFVLLCECVFVHHRCACWSEAVRTQNICLLQKMKQPNGIRSASVSITEGTIHTGLKKAALKS